MVKSSSNSFRFTFLTKVHGPHIDSLLIILLTMKRPESIFHYLSYWDDIQPYKIWCRKPSHAQIPSCERLIPLYALLSSLYLQEREKAVENIEEMLEDSRLLKVDSLHCWFFFLFVCFSSLSLPYTCFDLIVLNATPSQPTILLLRGFLYTHLVVHLRREWINMGLPSHIGGTCSCGHLALKISRASIPVENIP